MLWLKWSQSAPDQRHRVTVLHHTKSGENCVLMRFVRFWYRKKFSVGEIPSHNHSIDYTHVSGELSETYYIQTGKALGRNGYWHINATGGNGAHNNLQPVKAVYVWRRTA